MWVAPLGFALMGLTVAVGLALEAAGLEIGTATPPLLYRFEPRFAPEVLAVGGLFAAAAALAPRLCSRRLSPAGFVAATLALGLVLRLALPLARGGGWDTWWGVFELGRFEASNEYLPALPALDFGLHAFLDRFAELGPSLTVNTVGHPPGLLALMHLLGVETAPALAALTIGVGVLSIPLAYLLARQLADEPRARLATLLYVFAPAAVIHGATSADALYATVALVAAIPLVARGRSRHAGPPLLAVAAFFSYANLAIGAWATVVWAWRREWRRAAVLALVCAATLLALYGALYLVTGFDPLGGVRSAELVYREGIASTRPYAFWLFGAPAAFLIAAGLPVAWYALRALGEREVPAVAISAVLGVAAVLGFSKAETERIYLYLVPLLCIAAAVSLPPRRLPWVLAALAAQAFATELLFFTIW